MEPRVNHRALSAMIGRFMRLSLRNVVLAADLGIGRLDYVSMAV